MNKNNYIFLDFDGVLFDTVKESYLLARYAFYGVEPQVKYDESEYKIFHSARYLITNSWHYYYIMKIINEKEFKNIYDFEEKYNDELLNRDKEKDGLFDTKFQEKRKDLINNHYEFWNKLDEPYSFFYKIKDIQKSSNIIILSTKNEEAIIKHCNDYGLDIARENIIGKTKLKEFGSKKEYLTKYMSNNKIQNAIFIDDSISTINNCKDIPNLQTYVANWGYVKSISDGYNENELINKIKELNNG